MKVIWRQKDTDWEIAFGKGYRDEAQLQSFLAEYPAMIPFEDISDQILQPKVMLREVGLPGSGSTDIVGVDEEGGITILECKLAANPEVKRKVMGQVLEYAAFLWKKPYGFLDEVSVRRFGKPMVEAMHDALDEETRHDWGGASFVQSVTDRLLSGDFRMVIAVDSINDELRQTIEYLTEGPSRLQVYALELTYFEGGDQEILVPHLHGALGASRSSRPSAPSSTWDAGRFYDDGKSKDVPSSVLETMQALQEFCEATAHRIWWGHGKETGSFTYHLMKNGQTVSLFSVFSDGRVQFNFGWLRERVSRELLEQYRDNLRQIPTLRQLQVKEDFNHWPSRKLSAAIPGPVELAAFQKVILDLRDGVLQEGASGLAQVGP